MNSQLDIYNPFDISKLEISRKHILKINYSTEWTFRENKRHYLLSTIFQTSTRNIFVTELMTMRGKRTLNSFKIIEKSTGNYHRANGPAFYEQYQNRRLYYKHGLLHRLDGPAYVSDTHILWAIDGNEMTFDRWVADNRTTLSKEGYYYALKQ